LSGSDFEFDLHLNNMQQEFVVKTDFALDAAVDPVVAISGNIALKSQHHGIILCVVNGCELSELSLNYDLLAGASSLIGYSRCNSGDCSLASARHFIKTSNTQKFFSSLIESGIFNPLAVIFAQTQFQMGIGVGAGHELKF
jgi:hypothetical protein